MLKDAFQNKRIAVWQRAFRARKVLGTFQKQALALYRAVFKWLSKVMTWLWLLRLVIAELLTLMIGVKDSRQFFNQWETKPIAPCTSDFSRALSELQVIPRNCDWFFALFFLLWLVGVVALVLVFRKSFENHSIFQRWFLHGAADGRKLRIKFWNSSSRLDLNSLFFQYQYASKGQHQTPFPLQFNKADDIKIEESQQEATREIAYSKDCCF